MDHYQKISLELWKGRKDSEAKERFWQYVQKASISDLNTENNSFKEDRLKNNIALLGFACDLGVARNKGRVGAYEGCNSLRENLKNLSLQKDVNIYDFGNIICDSDFNNLEQSQLALGSSVADLLNNKFFPIILGGGHETAYGHYLGIKETHFSKKSGIINFDAHFDLRPLLDNNQGTSGTSFRQIYLDRKDNIQDFNYLCIGIQESANTKSLFDYAKYTGTEYILAKEFYLNKLENIVITLNQFLDKVDYVYLTICLDVFSQSVAPGVSAPQALGLMPHQVKFLLDIVKSSKKIITVDIVELNPKYDIDNMTAKLGANLIYDLIQ